MKKTITIGLILMFAMIFTGCNERDDFMPDVRGEWRIESEVNGSSLVLDYYFDGYEDSGDVYYDGEIIGFYSVAQDTISFTLQYYDEYGDYTTEVYTGYFDNYSNMSGNFIYNVEGLNAMYGVWTGYRL